MDARTYRVKNLAEALELIRRELGPNAALLHTRRVRRNSLGGWLGATELEVTAAADHELPSRLDEQFLSEWELADPNVSDVGASESNDSSDMNHLHRDFTADDSVSFEVSQQAMQASRRESAGEYSDRGLSPRGLRGASSAPSTREDTHRTHVIPQLSTSSRLASEKRVEASLLERSSQRMQNFSYTGPFQWHAGRSHWVALVGPTGVGKTTTLAKLAAEYRLQRKLEVGLVSLDTYRVNGAAHLHTYAEILQLPLHVVESVEEMRQTAASLTERYDVVLLDTGGQGPRDQEQRRRLKQLLEVARPDEVILTLSATSSAAVWRDSVRRFRELNPTSLIVTKLDEAPGESFLLDEIAHSQLPLSYFTIGQQVPEDIVLADSQTSYDWLVAPLSHTPGLRQEVA